MSDKDLNGAISSTPRVNESTHPELYASVGEKLAALSNEDDDASVLADMVTEQEAADEVVEESQAEETEGVTDDAAASSDASGDESTETESGEQAGAESQEAATDGVSTLPAAYSRSLKAYGWTDEEIQEAYDASPEMFLKTATKIHANRVQETSQWAAAGRAKQGQVEDPNAGDTGLMGTPDGQSAPETPATELPKAAIPGLDFKAMAEQSGLPQESLETAFTPVVDAITAINHVLPKINEGVAAIDSNREAQLAREVDSFFQSTDLTPYEAFYGKSWETVTDEQVQNRNKVLELADDMIVGAARHGRSLDAFEAMELAHTSVSSHMKEGVVRKQIGKQVNERRKGITLKPKSKDTAGTPNPSDRSTLLANTRERLAKAFG